MRTIPFRLEFTDGYDEQSSDEARAWEGAHGDLCLAVATRTPTGRWVLGCGGLWSPDGTDADALFSSVRAAIEYIAQANGAALVEAVCRCAAGGECD